jgi:tetratricopeptide (TPR) repeat protein
LAKSLDLKATSMPSTINGVGTHYYGKKNQSVRSAACRSCNRVANLESYDTRLWFVVIFIPIIPLGRKRILDACPSCTRHYVVKADVYEQTKQLQTSASLDRFRREQSTDSAIEAHGQLLGFHEHQQAAEFRQTALAKFPDHAGLRAAMAAQLREMSSYDESARLYQQAFDLDPDLPEARVGVAEWRIAEGNLDEAQQLLDFLMEPGVGQRYSLGPLDYLAGSLQKAGRHEETLVIAEVMLRELPKLGENRTFRAFVKRSQKAVGQADSILPEQSFSIGGLFRSEGSPYPPWVRKMVIGTIAGSLIAAGLAANNEFIKRNRTLHVLNATGQPAQVQVDGQPSTTVNGLGQLTVSEGPHVVKVSGPVNETRQIALDSSYFDRWFSKPAWVFNVGGEAVLEDVTHIYSARAIPGNRQLLVGESFIVRPHVDYIFTPAPNQLQTKNKNQEITKTELGWFQGDDLSAFMEANGTNHKAAMDFAEKRLRRNPKQPELIKYYVGQGNEDERGRIEAFLKSELDRKPVNIPWHRAYQAVAGMNSQVDALLSQYDKYLEADPNNASFLYLRGRIDPDWAKQEVFYRKSIEADPKLGWPWLAVASRANAEARWNDCQEAALKARALNVEESDRIGEMLHEVAMAKGTAKSLVEQYRVAANSNLQDASAILFLIDALAASGRESEIEPALKTWLARLPVQLQGQVSAHLLALGLYHAGKLEECVKFCQNSPIVKSSPSHFHALIALGRMGEASDEQVFGKLMSDPMNLLALSVGFQLEGKTQDATAWRAKALDLLEKLNDADTAKAAKFLSTSEPVAIEDVLHVHLATENKALVLTSLAERFPARRESYLAEASKFNIRRKPPYPLVRRAIEGKTPGQP